jgi:hypothetical protein
MSMNDRRYRAIPPTAMASAFLAALFRKTERGTPSNKTVIPTGIVNTDELRRVLDALKCAGRIHPSRRSERRPTVRSS